MIEEADGMCCRLLFAYGAVVGIDFTRSDAYELRMAGIFEPSATMDAK